MDHVRMADYVPIPVGGDQYPLEFIEHNQAIKLGHIDDEVVVGLAQGTEPQLERTLRSFHRTAVRFVEVDSAELSSYLGRSLSRRDGAQAVPARRSAEPAARTTASERARLDRLAHDAPIVNLVNSIVIDGIRGGASDVHIEAFADTVRVRYRIDGVLQTASEVPKDAFPGISSRVKVMANLNIMDRRLPQDGRITVNLLGRDFDIRVSVVPIAEGESIVLRLFDRCTEGLTLAELGFAQDQLERLKSILRRAHGLVLVTGPTGSGKTTTLTAIVRETAGDERKIVTIEDPVEYRIEGIDQIQTNEEIGLTFASLLRRVLRQDPDIIMVGEIRDGETAALALRAALTGHLVLASLHTNDAVSSVTRLVDMGVEPYLVAGVLRGVIAQRLVRKVCGACCRRRPPTPAERELFRRYGSHRNAPPTPQAVSVAVGCGECRRTGYRGRTSVAELFAADEIPESLISRGGETAELAAYFVDRGFRSIAQSALEKVAAGVTTTREIDHLVSTQHVVSTRGVQ
jgi:type II secretory ATPase GspE/PulE/Tfp pilus assembly ATPase PilB-like protein